MTRADCGQQEHGTFEYAQNAIIVDLTLDFVIVLQRILGNFSKILLAALIVYEKVIPKIVRSNPFPVIATVVVDVCSKAIITAAFKELKNTSVRRSKSCHLGNQVDSHGMYRENLF